MDLKNMNHEELIQYCKNNNIEYLSKMNKPYCENRLKKIINDFNKQQENKPDIKIKKQPRLCIKDKEEYKPSKSDIVNKLTIKIDYLEKNISLIIKYIQIMMILFVGFGLGVIVI